jgi:hypothetical protein
MTCRLAVSLPRDRDERRALRCRVVALNSGNRTAVPLGAGLAAGHAFVDIRSFEDFERSDNDGQSAFA